MQSIFARGQPLVSTDCSDTWVGCFFHVGKRLVTHDVAGCVIAVIAGKVGAVSIGGILSKVAAKEMCAVGAVAESASEYWEMFDEYVID